MLLSEYLAEKNWSADQFARKANLAINTVKRVLRGEDVRLSTALEIMLFTDFVVTPLELPIAERMIGKRKAKKQAAEMIKEINIDSNQHSNEWNGIMLPPNNFPTYVDVSQLIREELEKYGLLPKEHPDKDNAPNYKDTSNEKT